MDKYNLNEYSMRQSSIYELRNIARGVGVLSPTTLKKEELIEKVLKILSGEEKPQMPKNKKGRPPKNLFGTKNVTNMADFGSNNFLTQQDTSNTEIAILSSKKNYEDEVYYNSTQGKVEERTGYYSEYDGSGFIFECGKVSNVDTAILVHKNIVETNKIKIGDLIKCKCRSFITNNTSFLTEVLETNNNIKQINNGQNFEQMEIISNTKAVINSNKFNNLYLGSRNIFYVNNALQFSSIFEDLNVKNSNQTPIKFLNLKLDVLPEDLNSLKTNNTNNIENFYTLMGDSAKQNVFTIELFISRIKRLAELNYNVFVVVDDILKLVKYKNFVEGNSIKDIKNKSLDFCYKLLSTARCFANNSVTLFVGIKSSIKDNFYNTIVEELANLKCNFLNNYFI